MVRVYDRLTDIDDRSISGFGLQQVQRLLHGVPGTYVMLDFDRVTDIRFRGDAWGPNPTVKESGRANVNRYPYRVCLMRGNPAYIAELHNSIRGKGSAVLQAHDKLVKEVEHERELLFEMETKLQLEEGRMQQAQERQEKYSTMEATLEEEIVRL
eukprot:CAMPEP_0181332360 /NCGR_PEP_ID=MMETSP1101-20121128/25052_1 /TAXON_ID=46948 /ORGANISM="Rhodomonas abbreviata, Strain Caron Lab Isolate" /LENGTH=154 /DNA_ID=CAMNT_0023441999 /DNA_START=144 /DNA_END=604 /DNA_ORIENTATION=+